MYIYIIIKKPYKNFVSRIFQHTHTHTLTQLISDHINFGDFQFALNVSKSCTSLFRTRLTHHTHSNSDLGLDLSLRFLQHVYGEQLRQFLLHSADHYLGLLLQVHLRMLLQMVLAVESCVIVKNMYQSNCFNDFSNAWGI